MHVEHHPRGHAPAARTAAPGCARPRGGDPRARCPVCSCAVEAAGPRCLRCRAPHHSDCWRYNGGCGIYACQGALRQGDGLTRRERGEGASQRGAFAFVAALLVLAALRVLFVAAPLP